MSEGGGPIHVWRYRSRGVTVDFHESLSGNRVGAVEVTPSRQRLPLGLKPSSDEQQVKAMVPHADCEDEDPDVRWCTWSSDGVQLVIELRERRLSLVRLTRIFR